MTSRERDGNNVVDGALDAVDRTVRSRNWPLVISLVVVVACAANAVRGATGSIPLAGGALQLVGLLAIVAWWLRRRRRAGR